MNVDITCDQFNENHHMRNECQVEIGDKIRAKDNVSYIAYLGRTKGIYTSHILTFCATYVCGVGTKQLSYATHYSLAIGTKADNLEISKSL